MTAEAGPLTSACPQSVGHDLAPAQRDVRCIYRLTPYETRSTRIGQRTAYWAVDPDLLTNLSAATMHAVCPPRIAPRCASTTAALRGRCTGALIACRGGDKCRTSLRPFPTRQESVTNALRLHSCSTTSTSASTRAECGGVRSFVTPPLASSSTLSTPCWFPPVSSMTP